MISKPASEVIVHIDTLDQEGRGVGRHSGKAMFITGALPSETIRASYTKRHASYDEGHCEEIITASLQRVIPQCEFFQRCGGCSLQHLEASAQLIHKQNMLQGHLTHLGKVTPKIWLTPLTSPAWGYRHRTKLGVTYQKRNKVPTLGFRAKAANTIIPITHCAILSPKIGTRLTCLADTLGQLNTKVSQIKVSIGDTQHAILLESVGNITEKERNFLANDMKENDFSWYLRQEKASYPLNSLIPKLSYTIPSDKIKIDFNPEDFTQINPEVNYQLIKLVVELLGLSVQETVIDLYCGLGNFTLPVARHAGHVTGIEGSANMTRRAQENAASNNISNTSFYTSDLTSSKTWENSQWAKKRYTKLLMDPPRTGALALLPWIGQMRPQCIVYLSCHPVTFARDLGVLVHKYRYKLTKIGVIDMFPHTAHIESIAVLEL